MVENPVVSSIHVYPLKSGAGLGLPKAEVLPAGLAGDRRWMLVDEAGKFVTQRDYPAMATIRALPNLLGLTLEAPGRLPCNVSAPGQNSARVKVTVWKSTLDLPVADDAANAWCTRTMNKPVRLVYLDDDTLRTQTSSYAKAGDVVSLADGFPLLITTVSSLEALNREMTTPLPMSRFRPNLVIDGVKAWAEDTWQRIRIGTVELEVMRYCPRCAITQINQQTGMAESKEPIRTLRRLRFWAQDPGVLFGVYATARTYGQIESGQKVEILETCAPPEFRTAAE